MLIAADLDSGGPNQLLNGAAPFAQLKQSDLPAEWAAEVDAESRQHAAREMGLTADDVVPCVVVELPDLPWAWKYQQWAERADEPGVLPSMVVSTSAVRGGGAESGRAAMEGLVSLVRTGRPAPFFACIYLQRA